MEFTTGCHWSPLPLVHDDITELVDVRDLALLHLPYEDAPQMPPTCLTVGKTHLSLYSSPGCLHTRLTPSEPNQFILVSSMTLACLSSANCLQAFLCIIFRRVFLRQLCRPIWCSLQRMVWALTDWPPTPSFSAALIRLFPKHNLWIWRWVRALNFFGRPWRGLFWVEPVMLNRCMVFATVLQLSFKVLAIFLLPTPSLCRTTILFFSDPQRVLCHEVPCWTSSDQYERVRAITPNLSVFECFFWWVLSYFEGTANVHCYTSCTHYFIL